MLRPPTPFRPDHDRYFYEPRALWSVGYGQATTTGPQRTIRFPQEHFINGSRFPIRLTKLCVSPVGYFARSFTAQNAAQFDACMAGITRSLLSLEYPMGYSGQRRPGPVHLYGTDPTGDPDMENTATPYASSLFGVSRWDFDLPYYVPQTYQVALELSNIRAYLGVLAQTPVSSARAFYERTGSLILGHAVRRFGDIETTVQGSAYPGGPQPFNVPDDVPFTGANGASQTGWGAGGRWPGGEWPRQKANRGLPYTESTGFSVFLDQRAFDDAAFAAYNAQFPDLRMAPISQRIATKCRTIGAGTGEKWWRDGAPLSLVTPTITPAIVRDLEDPIVLGPGESIIVSLQLPPTYTVGQDTVNPIYSVGVSFTGYAVVEDNNRKVPPMPGELLPMPMTDT